MKEDYEGLAFDAIIGAVFGSADLRQQLRRATALHLLSATGHTTLQRVGTSVSKEHPQLWTSARENGIRLKAVLDHQDSYGVFVFPDNDGSIFLNLAALLRASGGDLTAPLQSAPGPGEGHSRCGSLSRGAPSSVSSSASSAPNLHTATGEAVEGDEPSPVVPEPDVPELDLNELDFLPVAPADGASCSYFSETFCQVVAEMRQNAHARAVLANLCDAVRMAWPGRGALDRLRRVAALSLAVTVSAADDPAEPRCLPWDDVRQVLCEQQAAAVAELEGSAQAAAVAAAATAAAAASGTVQPADGRGVDVLRWLLPEDDEGSGDGDDGGGHARPPLLRIVGGTDGTDIDTGGGGDGCSGLRLQLDFGELLLQRILAQSDAATETAALAGDGHTDGEGDCGGSGGADVDVRSAVAAGGAPADGDQGRSAAGADAGRANAPTAAPTSRHRAVREAEAEPGADGGGGGTAAGGQPQPPGGGSSRARAGTTEFADALAAAIAATWPGEQPLQRVKRAAAKLLAAVTTSHGPLPRHAMQAARLALEVRKLEREAFDKLPRSSKMRQLDESDLGGGGGGKGGGRGGGKGGGYLVFEKLALEDGGHVRLRLGELIRDWRRRQPHNEHNGGVTGGGASAAAAAAAARGVPPANGGGAAEAAAGPAAASRRGAAATTASSEASGAADPAAPNVNGAAVASAQPAPPAPPHNPEEQEEPATISLRPNGGAWSRPSTRRTAASGESAPAAAATAPAMPMSPGNPPARAAPPASPSKQHPKAVRHPPPHPAALLEATSKTSPPPPQQQQRPVPRSPGGGTDTAAADLPATLPPPPPPPATILQTKAARNPFEVRLLALFPKQPPHRPGGHLDAAICDLGRRVVRHLAAATAPPQHTVSLASLEALILRVRGLEALSTPLERLQAVYDMTDRDVFEFLSLPVADGGERVPYIRLVCPELRKLAADHPIATPSMPSPLPPPPLPTPSIERGNLDGAEPLLDNSVASTAAAATAPPPPLHPRPRPEASAGTAARAAAAAPAPPRPVDGHRAAGRPGPDSARWWRSPGSGGDAAAGGADVDVDGCGFVWVGEPDQGPPPPPQQQQQRDSVARQRLRAAVARRLPAAGSAGESAAAAEVQRAAAELLALQGPPYSLSLQQLGGWVVKRLRCKRLGGSLREALARAPNVFAVEFAGRQARKGTVVQLLSPDLRKFGEAVAAEEAAATATATPTTTGEELPWRQHTVHRQQQQQQEQQQEVQQLQPGDVLGSHQQPHVRRQRHRQRQRCSEEPLSQAEPQEAMSGQRQQQAVRQRRDSDPRDSEEAQPVRQRRRLEHQESQEYQHQHHDQQQDDIQPPPPPQQQQDDIQPPPPPPPPQQQDDIQPPQQQQQGQQPEQPHQGRQQQQELEELHGQDDQRGELRSELEAGAAADGATPPPSAAAASEPASASAYVRVHVQEEPGVPGAAIPGPQAPRPSFPAPPSGAQPGWPAGGAPVSAEAAGPDLPPGTERPLPEAAVQMISDPYSHEYARMLQHYRECKYVGLAVQSYDGKVCVLSLYAPAAVRSGGDTAAGGGHGWTATVYLFNCVSCADDYGGGASGEAVVSAMLQTSLRRHLENTAVTKVVYGCEQVRVLELACGGATIGPILDLSSLCSALVAMLQPLPPLPPQLLSPPPLLPGSPSFSSSSSKPLRSQGAAAASGAVPPASGGAAGEAAFREDNGDESADDAAATAANDDAQLLVHARALCDALQELGLWWDRPHLMVALERLHITGQLAALLRTTGRSRAWLSRHLSSDWVAVAAGAARYLPELWEAVAGQAIPWVAARSAARSMRLLRSAPTAMPSSAASASTATTSTDGP